MKVKRYTVSNLTKGYIGLSAGSRIAPGGSLTLPESVLKDGDFKMAQGGFIRITEAEDVQPITKAPEKLELPVKKNKPVERERIDLDSPFTADEQREEAAKKEKEELEKKLAEEAAEKAAAAKAAKEAEEAAAAAEDAQLDADEDAPEPTVEPEEDPEPNEADSPIVDPVSDTEKPVIEESAAAPKPDIMPDKSWKTKMILDWCASQVPPIKIKGSKVKDNILRQIDEFYSDE